jgi:GNAT superfamily N-acetyltransferase
MLEFSAVEARPDSSWAIEAYHGLDVAHSLEVLGEDLTMSAERTRAFLASEETGLRVLLLAVAGPPPSGPPGRLGLPPAPTSPREVLGVALFSLPTADNQHLVDDLFIMVAAEARRHGVATALLQQVLRIAHDRGRDTVLAWSERRIGPDADALPQLAAPTGSGTIPADGNALFLQAMGFELAQVERQSRLQLPVPGQLLENLRSQAEAAAGGGYRIVSWRGEVPVPYLEPVADLYGAMSTDAPVGGVDFRAEHWDAERVLRHDRELLLSGELVQTIALSSATGQAVAHTALFVPLASPERPEQHNTVVLSEHRGHRLGLWVKASNLAFLATEFPQARHIDTWNADENSHMLAINTALGFRPHAVTGAWQIRVG